MARCTQPWQNSMSPARGLGFNFCVLLITRKVDNQATVREAVRGAVRGSARHTRHGVRPLAPEGLPREAFSFLRNVVSESAAGRRLPQPPPPYHCCPYPCPYCTLPLLTTAQPRCRAPLPDDLFSEPLRFVSRPYLYRAAPRGICAKRSRTRGRSCVAARKWLQGRNTAAADAAAAARGSA